MKISFATYSFVAILSILMLTGFTCSKHAPDKTLNEATSDAGKNSIAVPQEQMSDQVSSSDSTSVTH